MAFRTFAPIAPLRAREHRRRPHDDDPFADQFAEYDDDDEERAHKSNDDLTEDEAKDIGEDPALLDREHHRHGATLAAWISAASEDGASRANRETRPARSAHGQPLDATMAHVGAAFDAAAARQGRDRTVRQAQAGHNALLGRFNAEHPSNVYLDPDDPNQAPRLRPLKVDGVSGPKTRFNLRHMAAIAGPEAVVAAHDAGAEILAPAFDTPATRLRVRQADRHGPRDSAGGTDNDPSAESMGLSALGRRAGEFVSGANDALYETLGGPVDAANWAARQTLHGAARAADAFGFDETSDAIDDRAEAQRGTPGSSAWINRQADRVIPDITPTDETGRDLRVAGGAAFDLGAAVLGLPAAGRTALGAAANARLVDSVEDVRSAAIGSVEQVAAKAQPRARQAMRELKLNVPEHAQGQWIDRLTMVEPRVVGVRGAPRPDETPMVALGQFGDRGEATGMVAVLDKTSLGRGTPTRKNVDPPGIDEVQILPTDRNPPTPIQKAHLLARALGGSGVERRNLTPLHRIPNKEMFDEVEKRINRAIKNGEVVRYAVTPRYRKGAAAPYKIVLRARGSGGFTLDREIRNILVEDR